MNWTHLILLLVALVPLTSCPSVIGDEIVLNSISETTTRSSETTTVAFAPVEDETETDPERESDPTTTTKATPDQNSSATEAVESKVVTSSSSSSLASSDPETDRLKQEVDELRQSIRNMNDRMDETNKRLIHLLGERDTQFKNVNESFILMLSDVKRSSDLMRERIMQLDLMMKQREEEKSKNSREKELEMKMSQMAQRLEKEMDSLKSDQAKQILLHNRIIIISLSIVSLPISFLLILILYLTLKRDKKIVKAERRIALNEMNHLRRYYND